MPQAWNPNTPIAVGNEQGLRSSSVLGQSIAEAAYGVSGPDRMRALRWTALASGQLDAVRLYAAPGSSVAWIDQANAVVRSLMVEITPRAFVGTDDGVGEAAGEVTTTDVTTASGNFTGWTDEAGGAAVVADVQTVDDGHYVKTATAINLFDLNFNTAALFGGRHILSVEVHVRCKGSCQVTIDGATVVDGTGRSTQHAGNDWTELVFQWPELSRRNFGALLWWTPADVQALAAGNLVNVVNKSPAGSELQVDYVFLRVQHVAERRLAVGVAPPGGMAGTTAYPSDDQWVEFALQNPTRTGAWARVNGTTYTLFLRRGAPWQDEAHAEATMFWRYLRGNPPFFGFQARHVTVAMNGGLPQPASTQAVDGIPAIRFRGPGPVDLPESQPYTNGWAVTTGSGPSDGYQVLTAPSNLARDLVYLWLSEPFEDPANPILDRRLTVEIRNAAGAVVHQTVTVDPEYDPLAPTIVAEDLPFSASAASRVMRRCRFRLPTGFAPVAATQYRLCAYPAQAGLYKVAAVVVGDTVPPSTPEASNDSQSYGAAAESLEGSYVTASPFNNKGDMLAVWTSLPGPPTAVAVSVQTQNTGQAADACGRWRCPVETIKFARVTWNAPAAGVGASFYRYDVERWTAYDGWQRIAQWPLLAGQAVVRQVDDYEARVGVVTKYRVRYVRGDEAESDWVETGNVTLTADGTELLFTSNADPTRNVAYVDVDAGGGVPNRGYTLPKASETVLRTVYGRDYAVAFRPAERRGMVFERTVLLSAYVAIANPTTRVMEPLTGISEADLPYVCVRDTEGNRWLAAVTVPDVTGRIGAANRHFATVGVTEVTAAPTVDVGMNPQMVGYV